MTKHSTQEADAQEEWREVPGINGEYRVSSFGRVFNVNSMRIVRPAFRGGYFCVYVKGIQREIGVHRLVAWAFVGECPVGWVVNHKDLNKLNNRPDNLEYLTNEDNIRHAAANGAKGIPVWQRSECIFDMCMRRAVGMSYADIAARYMIDKARVREVVLQNFDTLVDAGMLRKYDMDEPVPTEYDLVLYRGRLIAVEQEPIVYKKPEVKSKRA